MLTELGEHIEILWPAFLAGVLVLSTHIPLGQEVLKRGIIFLDLAIAQIAGLGLILAAQFEFDAHSETYSKVIAVIAAMTGAFLLYQLRRFEAKIQEACIGTLFILSATGSILLLSQDPHGGERLKEMLVGQILWVSQADLWLIGILYALVLGFWFGMRSRLGEWIFYPLFALSITFSTQLVGVYLVFTSLIIPALATHYQKNPLMPAYIIGIIGYSIGLGVSALWDLPSGATTAWSLATVGLLYVLCRRFFLNKAAES